MIDNHDSINRHYVKEPRELKRHIGRYMAIDSDIDDITYTFLLIDVVPLGTDDVALITNYPTAHYYGEKYREAWLTLKWAKKKIYSIPSKLRPATPYETRHTQNVNRKERFKCYQTLPMHNKRTTPVNKALNTLKRLLGIGD